jgi:hypothetical protein
VTREKRARTTGHMVFTFSSTDLVRGYKDQHVALTEGLALELRW